MLCKNKNIKITTILIALFHPFIPVYGKKLSNIFSFKAKKKSAPPEPAHAGFGGLFRKLSKRDKERAARQASDLSTASGHRGVSRSHVGHCLIG